MQIGETLPRIICAITEVCDEYEENEGYGAAQLGEGQGNKTIEKLEVHIRHEEDLSNVPMSSKKSMQCPCCFWLSEHTREYKLTYRHTAIEC